MALAPTLQSFTELLLKIPDPVKVSRKLYCKPRESDNPATLTFYRFEKILISYLEALDTHIRLMPSIPFSANYFIATMTFNLPYVADTYRNEQVRPAFSFETSLLAQMLFHKLPALTIEHYLLLCDHCPADAIVALFQPSSLKKSTENKFDDPVCINPDTNPCLAVFPGLLTLGYPLDLYKKLLFKFLQLAKDKNLPQAQVATVLNREFFISLFRDSSFLSLSKDQKLEILNPVYAALDTTLIQHILDKTTTDKELQLAYTILDQNDEGFLTFYLSELSLWANFDLFILTAWMCGPHEKILDYLINKASTEVCTQFLLDLTLPANEDYLLKRIRINPSAYFNCVRRFRDKISETDFLKLFNRTIHETLLQANAEAYLDFLAEISSDDLIKQVMALISSPKHESPIPHQVFISAMVEKLMTLTPARGKLFSWFLSQLSLLDRGLDIFNAAIIRITNQTSSTKAKDPEIPSSLLAVFAKLHHLLSTINNSNAEEAIHFSGIIHIFQTQDTLENKKALLEKHIKNIPPSLKSYKPLAEALLKHLNTLETEAMTVFSSDVVATYYALIIKGNPTLAEALSPATYETRRDALQNTKKAERESSFTYRLFSLFGGAPGASSSDIIPSKPENINSTTVLPSAPHAGAGQDTALFDEIPTKPTSSNNSPEADPSTPCSKLHDDNDVIIKNINDLKFEWLFEQIVDGKIQPSWQFEYQGNQYNSLLSLIDRLKNNSNGAKNDLLTFVYTKIQELIEDPRRLRQCKDEYAEAYCRYQKAISEAALEEDPSSFSNNYNSSSLRTDTGPTDTGPAEKISSESDDDVSPTNVVPASAPCSSPVVPEESNLSKPSTMIDSTTQEKDQMIAQLMARIAFLQTPRVVHLVQTTCESSSIIPTETRAPDGLSKVAQIYEPIDIAPNPLLNMSTLTLTVHLDQISGAMIGTLQHTKEGSSPKPGTSVVFNTSAPGASADGLTPR